MRKSRVAWRGQNVAMARIAASWSVFLVLVACGMPPPSPSSEDAGDTLKLDAGVDAGVDAGTTPLVLSHAALEDCRARAIVAPTLPGQAGYWAATRWVAPSTPFTATRVEYGLGVDPTCSATLVHHVAVTVDDGGVPARDLRWTSTSVDSSRAVRDVLRADGGVLFVVMSVPIDPVVVNPGQTLTVAVELVGKPGSNTVSSCLLSCRDAAARSGEDYWSNAPQAPFDWEDLRQLGSTLGTRVVGHVPASP